MAEYGWRIIRDCIGDGEAVGVIGPRDISSVLRQLLQDGCGQKFRLYDDDGILYYEGRMMMEDSRIRPSDSECALAPLDDYGAPDSGCTEIHWLVNGEWVQV